MPVNSDLRVSVTVEDILRSWGPKRARLASPRMIARVSGLLEQIEAEQWMQPNVSYRIWPITELGPEGIELACGTRLRAPLANQYLRNATHIGLGFCTIGSKLEEHVAGLFDAKEGLRGVLMDEIASLLLYRLGDRLEDMIREEAATLGVDISGVLSAGEEGFDLTEHAVMLELAGATNLGISVTALGMLKPQKSVSLLFGLGKDMPKWNRAERCERCVMRDRCPFREYLTQQTVAV